jgi:hypothetical protein
MAICIDAALAQYHMAVRAPSLIEIDLTGDPESVHRAVLAVALSQSPTYLGAAHLLPVVDAFLALSGATRLVDVDRSSETTHEAMCMAMVGIDLRVSEARGIISRVQRHLLALEGDVTTVLSHGSADEIRNALEDLFKGDPCQCQYLLDCAGIDIRATPTGGSTQVAVKLGLVHFSEGLFGFEHLRQAVRAELEAYPVSLWHVLQFLSDAVCDSHVGCAGCACSQTCHALCQEGWA